MKKSLFAAAFLSLTVLLSCSKQSINELAPDTQAILRADFTLDGQNGTVNEQDALLLTNTSENAVAYHWDFGNGTTSLLKQPAFSYPRCGNYTITLTVTAADGRTETIKKDIVVLCIFGGKHLEE